MISKQGENLVFLLGVPRSGTTLLSVMLDGHSQVRCPPEPWLMLALESLGRTSARSPADAPVLYRAMKEFCDPSTAISAARSYATIAYNHAFDGTGKKILVDKTPRYYLILPWLVEVFPRAKYLILLRNPLDIATSMFSTWQVDVPAQLAAGEDHLNCIDLVVGLRRLLDFSKEHSDRVHTLRYEQLVRQPQKTFNAVLNWLDVPREKFAGFELAGGEFDRGDIGDKKILSTSSPHQKSVGRWSRVLDEAQQATIVKSIGPHLFTALGYGDVLNESLLALDPAHSNAYAQRLEQSLASRNGEYDSVETFSDLTTQERRLNDALLGRAAARSQPVAMDLASELRAASDAANSLSAKLTQHIARIGELDREAAAAAARLDETRNLVRAQADHLASREAEWTSKHDAQTHDIQKHQLQLAQLHEQLKNEQLQLERMAADHSAQCQTITSITLQLENTGAELHRTLGDLAGHRARVIELSHLHQESQGVVQETRGHLQVAQARFEELQGRMQETQASLQGSFETIARQRLDALELTEQLRRLTEANAATNQHAEELSTKLNQAHETIASMRRAPVNRRPWPYAIPDAPPLPATLPGGKPWPKISIVTPSFNQGGYIEQTILSILGQNYPNLEYILIDGGSTDETMSVVDRYRDRISVVISEKDHGQSNAINKGFARATGELLTWINSDDMLESGALAAMAMAFHTSGADMVAGVCTLHTGGVVASRHVTACGAGPLPLDDLLDLEHCWLKGQFFYQPEVMFTRDLWLRAGGQIDEKLYYSMDYDLWLRFAQQRAILHVIGRPVALYRIHEQQKTFKIEEYRPELNRVRHQFLQRSGKKIDRNGHSKNGHMATARTHLRVLFFNDLGDVGGAGIAHQRLAAAVALAGHEVIPVAICPTLTRCQLSNDDLLQAITDRTPDIVFLGNIHSAQLDPALIGLIAKRWTTVQVLHDLYSLTGRCAYTGDCGKFITGCDDDCPTAGDYPALDSSRISNAWKLKHEAMTGGNPPILAAVSDWTQTFAHRRFEDAVKTPSRSLRYAGEPVSTAVSQPSPTVHVKLPQHKPAVVNIRYGLPTDQFKPRDKSTCRDMLDLPQDRFIVLFSSTNLADRRKGLNHLIDALESLKLPDLLAVCIGQPDASLQTKGFETRSMGYIADVNSLAVLYSAADIYVGPSEVETFGQVFIEAAACGTPSVAYATAGGVTDAIADGVSGCLAATQTSAGLAAQIARLHDEPGLRRDMGAWGRLWVENQFSLRSAYQRMFAQLGSVIKKLNLPPKVAFFHDKIQPPKITYLDAPPPPPTATQLLAEAASRIAELQNQKNQLAAQSAIQIAGLENERQQLQRESESRIASLQTERDALRTESQNQILSLKTERDSLQSDSERLAADNNSLRVSLHDVTHTRLWRMVGAVYPIYQRILSAAFVPAIAKLPGKAIANWLGEKRDRGDPDE